MTRNWISGLLSHKIRLWDWTLRVPTIFFCVCFYEKVSSKIILFVLLSNGRLLTCSFLPHHSPSSVAETTTVVYRRKQFSLSQTPDQKRKVLLFHNVVYIFYFPFHSLIFKFFFLKWKHCYPFAAMLLHCKEYQLKK